MKFYAAALLACAAAAINLGAIKDATTAKRELPFPAPTDCGTMPTKAPADADELFKKIDVDGNNTISAQEGFNALYCLNKWEVLSEAEAWKAYDFFKGEAKKNKAGLTKDEFKAGVEKIIKAIGADE